MTKRYPSQGKELDRRKSASQDAPGREIGEEPRLAPDHLLIYRGRLPDLNRDHNWWERVSLKKKCLKQWGVLPKPLRVTRRAKMEVVRVLGPRERILDFDNFVYRFKGGQDALVAAGYLVDDSLRWLAWPPIYWNDADRRQEGPKVEVRIFYE